MNDLISIIIPVYNVEKYLKKCINSVSNQTYKEIEIIVIDDGSTDNSGDICEQISLTDKRIRVFHKKNGGLSSARNYGIQKALGKYIIFIDSDDWVKDTMVQDLYEAVKNYNVKMACCGRINYKSEIDFKNIGIEESKIFTSEEIIRLAAFDNQVGIAAWGKIYDKQLFDKIEFPYGEIHEDVAVMYKIFHKSERIFVLGKFEYFYRCNNEGISKSNYSKKFDVVLSHNLENEKFIKENYSDLYNFIQGVTASSCIGMIIKIVKTQNGYDNFLEEFNAYKIELKKRVRNYLKYKKNTLRDFLWLIIIFSINSKTKKIYKKIGLVK